MKKLNDVALKLLAKAAYANAVKQPNSRIYGWSFDHECGILHLENQLR